MLQWGRGLSTPEITGAISLIAQSGHASMGPGSFDPGNEAHNSGLCDKTDASMGPGSFDPGNPALASRPSCASACFNGAGVFRPRKCSP